MTEELRKQYDVVQVQPQEDYPEDLDVLLAALPNTLTQPEMDRLSDYIASGNPTLLLTDPLPSFNLTLSPSEQKGASNNPFAGKPAARPRAEGDIQGLLRRFGVEWTGLIVWDQYNPHPGMAHLPPEVVFASSGNENPDTFNQEAVSTAALQELVFIFPGRLQHTGSADFSFTPLVQSGSMSGLTAYSQLVQRNFFGGSQLVLTNIPRRATQNAYTVAARVTGNAAKAVAGEGAAGTTAGTGENTPVNLVVVADVDFASQQFFDIRRMGAAGLRFDNVTFFLNLMDVLVGDESFIALRSKRCVTARSRPSKGRPCLHGTTGQGRGRREEEAQAALDQARRRLTARVTRSASGPTWTIRPRRISGPQSGGSGKPSVRDAADQYRGR